MTYGENLLILTAADRISYIKVCHSSALHTSERIKLINYNVFIVANLNKTMQNIRHTMNKTIQTYIYSSTWDYFL